MRARAVRRRAARSRVAQAAGARARAAPARSAGSRYAGLRRTHGCGRRVLRSCVRRTSRAATSLGAPVSTSCRFAPRTLTALALGILACHARPGSARQARGGEAQPPQLRAGIARPAWARQPGVRQRLDRLAHGQRPVHHLADPAVGPDEELRRQGEHPVQVEDVRGGVERDRVAELVPLRVVRARCRPSSPGPRPRRSRAPGRGTARPSRAGPGSRPGTAGTTSPRS